MHLLSFFNRFFDGANHVERLLGQVIVLAVQNLGKSTHGVAQRDVLPGLVRKGFGNEEGLGQEALNLAGAEYRLPVFVRQVLRFPE